MHSIWKDFGYAARVLAKSPGFTIVVVLSLALGLGANTAVFSIVNDLLVRPMPVDKPEELVAIYQTSPQSHNEIIGVSYPDLLDYRKQETGLSDLMGSTGIPLSMTDGEKPELIWGEIVTGNYFSGLGVRPILGRGFLPEEDRAPGEKPVCVLNYNFWRRHFQSDPNIIGKTIQINGHTFRVIGVAPHGFIGTTLFNFIADVWVPVMMQRTIAPGEGNFLEGRGSRWISLRGRLKPGVSRQQAEAAMNVVARQLGAAYPKTNKDLRVSLIPGGTRTQPWFVASGMIASATSIGFGVVVLVLLIACANVANLMLTRGASRAREMAIRLAVGASRARLVRQLLTESVLLSLAGCALGLVLAYLFNDMLAGFYPTLDFQTADLEYDSQLDPRVFAFAFLLSLATAVLCGLLPALRASKVDQASAMRGAAAAPLGRLPWLGRGNALVMAQVALSCILLIGGGLFLRSMQFAENENPGFDRTGIVMFSVDLDLQRYEPDRGRLFHKNIVEQLKTVPGVEGASVAFPLPLDAYQNGATVRVEGYVPRSDSESQSAGLSSVGSHYFETMGTRLVAGRGFNDQDTKSSTAVGVVNETMARRYWQTPEKALGRRFATGPDGPWIQVAGVAKDGKYFSFGETPSSYLFLPLTQNYSGRTTVVVRSAVDPKLLMPRLQQAVRSLDASLPTFGVRTMRQFLTRIVSVYEMGASLFGTFAVTGLLLAAVGIYGVLHFIVSRRTREIGIRMALGASRGEVLRLVLRRSLAFVAAGLLLGICGSLAASRATGTLLAGVSGADPLTIVAVAMVFVLVSLAASAVPAWRAARVDPMQALRYE